MALRRAGAMAAQTRACVSKQAERNIPFQEMSMKTTPNRSLQSHIDSNYIPSLSVDHELDLAGKTL